MTSPIAWPADIRPSTSSFRLEANTVLNESPLSRAQQVLIRPGTRWRCDLTFNSRNISIAGRIDALLDLLNGSGARCCCSTSAGRFRSGAPISLTNPITTTFDDGTIFDDGTRFVDAYSAEVPTVSAAATKGSEFVSTQGWGNNEYIFRAGDYIGLGGYLYRIAADVQTDPVDIGVLQLRPLLRTDAAVGDVVTVVQPTCRFRLADNNQGGNITQPGMSSSYTISFLESLP